MIFVLHCNAFHVDVETFGAVADNKTLSSGAINKALLNVSRRGGGIVYARAKGSYLVGRIEMQSDVTFSIGINTVLQGSPHKKDWTPRTAIAPKKCGGTFVENSVRGGLFWAVNAHNFTITGGGTVDGAGAVFNNDFDHRSNMFVFYSSSDILVEDLHIQNSSAWTLNPKYCQNVHFRRLRIEGDPEGVNHHNTDGFDPWACTNASFTDSYYAAGDDCVAIKSGKQTEAWTCGIASENIYVNNITCAASHGLTIGSEMAGGIRNVTFSNIHMLNSGASVKIKSQCGRGSYVKDVLYENITGSNVEYGIWIDMQYGKGPKKCNASGTSLFSNIRVINLFAKKVTKAAFEIVGLSVEKEPSYNPIQNLYLQNITVKDYKSLGTCVHANITLSSVTPAPPKNSTCFFTKLL